MTNVWPGGAGRGAWRGGWLVIVLFAQLLGSSHAASDPKPITSIIVVTSAEGDWRSARHGRISVLMTLPPQDKVSCRGDGGGPLRVSVDGVAVEYVCRRAPYVIEPPAKPTLSARWLASLRALAGRPRPSSGVEMLARGEQGLIEAVVARTATGVDLDAAVAGLRDEAVPPTSIDVRLQRLDDAATASPTSHPSHTSGSGTSGSPSGSTGSTTTDTTITIPLARPVLPGRHAPGLYRLRVSRTGAAALIGADASVIVYVPPPARAIENAARFAEVRTLTADWPSIDARNFRIFCLLALADEETR